MIGTKQDMAALGEPTELRVERDGARDLVFKGWQLGEGNAGTGGNSGYAKDWTRGVRVRVHLTTGGRLVTGVRRWSRWQGEDGSADAAVHTTPAAALAWLQEDDGGRLGRASKEAWEAACEAYPPLAGEAVERIE